jgi:hypothetical protein
MCSSEQPVVAPPVAQSASRRGAPEGAAGSSPAAGRRRCRTGYSRGPTGRRRTHSPCGTSAGNLKLNIHEYLKLFQLKHKLSKKAFSCINYYKIFIK